MISIILYHIIRRLNDLDFLALFFFSSLTEACLIVSIVVVALLNEEFRGFADIIIPVATLFSCLSPLRRSLCWKGRRQR